MDWIETTIWVPRLVALFILGLCAIYLLRPGEEDEDGEAQPGFSRLGLAAVSVIVIALLVRFGWL